MANPEPDSIIKALAKCSPKGPGERQLQRWVELQPFRKVLPQPFGFKAPLVLKTGSMALGTLQCVLPHEAFATLWQHCPKTFEELFGSEAERKTFWNELDRIGRELGNSHRAQEHRHWLEHHPANEVPPEHRVPLGIHGDGGTMHGGEKITALSWGGLVRKGSTADTRLMFVVLKDSEAVTSNTTLYKAFDVLKWSLQCLVTGLHPVADHEGQPFGPDHWPERAKRAGEPLAPVKPRGKLCGAWCELRGDWEFLRSALGLQHHYGAKQICHLCQACADGPMAYGDHFTADGPLRETLVGPEPNGPNGWASKTPVSPLTQIPGFSVWRCMYDIMHTLDLGILQRLIAASLQGLLGLPAGANRSAAAAEASFWPARTHLARCQQATNAYREWANSTKVPQSSRVKRITTRWVTGAFPDVLQKHAKAAALRAMLPWVAEVAEARRGQSEVATLRATCLHSMAALDRVYSQQGRFLTAAEEQQAKEHCIAALQALGDLCKLQPDGPWKLTPKCHALLHIALDSAMANPRLSHCYQDEDFIGRTKRTYTACHGATAPMRTIQRYCMGTSVTLTAREEVHQGKRKLQTPVAGGGPLRGAAACSAPSSSSSSPSDTSAGPAPSQVVAKRTTRGRAIGRPRRKPSEAYLPKGPRGRPCKKRA